MSEPGRVELLELDVDIRIADIWREADAIADWDLTHVAAFMRAAYGRGYSDGLLEPTRGLLCVDHGYRVPDRQAAA